MRNFFILLSIALLALVSCSKIEGQGANESQSEDTKVLTEHVCVSDSLCHHKAKAATFNEFGCIEYWECPECCRFYRDKEMQDAVTGTPLLLPLKYAKFKKAIGDLYGDDEAFLEEVEVNLKKNSLINTLPANAKRGLSTRAEEDGSSYKTAFSLIAKSALLLYRVASGTKGYVEATNTDGYGGRKETLDSIFVLIEDIEVTIDEMDAKMDEISDLVNSIYYDVPELINYSTAINDRYRSLSDLYSETTATLLMMDKYQDSFPTPVSQADSVQLESLWKSAVKEWGDYNNGYYLKMTEDLLAKYTYPLATHPELNYPQVLKAFTNYYTAIESEGYAFRGLILCVDALEMAEAYLLYSLYYYYLDNLSEAYKQKILDKAKSDYESYLAAMKADIEERYYGYTNYFIISTYLNGKPVAKYFSRKEVKVLDFEGYVKKADQEKRSYNYYWYDYVCPYPYICLDFLNENNVNAESVLTVEDMDLINASLSEDGSGKQSLKDYFGGLVSGIPDNENGLLLYAYTNYSRVYQDPIICVYGYGDESGMCWEFELNYCSFRTGDPSFGFYWYDDKGNYKHSVFFSRKKSQSLCDDRADFIGDGTDDYYFGQDKVWTLNCVKIETLNY